MRPSFGTRVLASRTSAVFIDRRTVNTMLTVPQWARPAIGAMLAAAVTFGGPMDAAFASVDTPQLLAGRSGGRVGGRVSAPRMAPRPSGGGYSGGGYGGGRTNIYMAPPMGGYGMMGGYGGYGYGGGNGVGLYLGLSLAETFLREQQRQAYLQQQLRTQQELGADQAAIKMLQMELESQNAKVDQLRSQQQGGAPAAPSLSQQAAPGESEAVRQLQQQLMQQQKELESLKAAQAK